MYKLLLKSFAAVLVAFFVVGCSGKDSMADMPLKKFSSTYTLNNFDFKFKESGRDAKNLKYMNENDVKNSFLKDINEHLKLEKISGNEFLVDLDLNYERRFAFNGNSIVSPLYSFTLKIYDNNKKLITTKKIDTTSPVYVNMEAFSVKTQIGTNQWDEKDEPTDIENISQRIARELANLGKR
ncbi:MAG: hypothetical protein ACK5LP_03500 [Campylobacteraceae bacterium]